MAKQRYAYHTGGQKIPLHFKGHLYGDPETFKHAGKNFTKEGLEEHLAGRKVHGKTLHGKRSGQDFNILGHAALPGGHAGYGR